jgi:hypothetical protein
MSIARQRCERDIETVGMRLEEAARTHKFGVIAVIDLRGKMAEKGVEFGNACKIWFASLSGPSGFWRKT